MEHGAWRVSPGRRRLPTLSSRLHASVCLQYLLCALVVDGRRRDQPRADKVVVGDEARRGISPPLRPVRLPEGVLEPLTSAVQSQGPLLSCMFAIVQKYL